MGINKARNNFWSFIAKAFLTNPPEQFLKFDLVIYFTVLKMFNSVNFNFAIFHL